MKHPPLSVGTQEGTEGHDMSTMLLPKPIAAYVAAANAQDAEAVAACFSEGAVVLDEERERQGIDDIHDWAEEVSAKYHPTIRGLSVDETDEGMIVTFEVSGDFPGSPIELGYDFAVHEGKIDRLEIS